MMNTEERIKSHLKAMTSHLVAEDRLEQVMEEGRRRQIRARTVRVLGAAAVVALFVGVLNVLDTGPGGPPVATEPTPDTRPTETTVPETPPTTIPTEAAEPRGVIVAGPDGLTVLDRDGNTLLELTDAGPYSDVAWAAPDLSGGIVFQHETTPMPWEQDTVLRLAPGAAEPSVVVSPPSGANIVPIGTGEGEAGQPLLYYLVDRPTDVGSVSRLTAIDLDSGETREIQSLEYEPGVSVMLDVGGPVVAFTRDGEDCRQLEFAHISDGPIDSPLSDECFPRTTMTRLSADGQSLATLPFQGTELVVRSVRTGETLWQREIPAGAFNLTAGEAGWAVQTPAETLLVSESGAWSLPPVEQGSAVPFVDLEVGYDAGLGGEDAALPCQPQEIGLPPHDLPPAVAETREQLAALAASCDYEGLAAIVEADGTTISFGAAGDPVEFWVAEGRAGRDPLAVLAALLTTTPAEDPAGYWAWPAVHVDPSNEVSWAELEPILGADTTEELRQYGEGYLGWRVGIAPDGTWGYFVAGD
ncbi:MAG TPA: hypothetical protein VF377_04350 [Acidimicrobiia bacterium]